MLVILAIFLYNLDNFDKSISIIRRDREITFLTHVIDPINITRVLSLLYIYIYIISLIISIHQQITRLSSRIGSPSKANIKKKVYIAFSQKKNTSSLSQE